jgi:perosamine synthetase
MSNRIYYTKPSITELEITYANDAVKNGWGEKCYDYIYKLEEAFKSHLGVKYAIATSSCTGALHLGMAALGIEPGDEVILADTNWIATVAPVVYLGAKPIFVDILPNSWCIDPNLVEKAITERTKAIIAVHLYGNLCNMDELQSIGKKYNIPVIEDAAEAIGSIYHGNHAGSMGIFGTFSFHGTKTVTTGEGGMFVTNEKNLYEKVLTLNNHGRSQYQTRQFWPDMIGYKYKMSNIQAAIGLAQIERIDELINRKRDIFHYYQTHLGKIPGISMNPEPEDTINGAWMPTAVFDVDTGITREKLQAAFSEENIDARVFFWPLSSLPPFNLNPQNTHAYSISKRAINLPSYHNMSQKDQDRVIKIIRTMYFQKGEMS